MFPPLGISDEHPRPPMNQRDVLHLLLFFATAVMAAWVLYDVIALVR
jgi:hypothetical protein